ncbi:MAG: hypothetical protein AB8G26_12900 [Ilumatobacter sp.]
MTSTEPVVETTEPRSDLSMVPGVASVERETLVEHDRRTALDGGGTYFWPDGTIGSVTGPDGTVMHFAANGSVIARTTGTATDPSGALLDARIEIDGVSDEFDYAAGGPVYVDPDTGDLLLWYHAERNLDGNPALFHAAIGIARSTDGGASFSDLGIIIETNSVPNPASPCCADVGGAPMIVRDGEFHVYHRDRSGEFGLTEVQLTRSSAPVDEVLAAARAGTVSAWTKYNRREGAPALGGRGATMEVNNLKTSWFDIAWHDELGRYLMVIAVHGTLSEPSELVMISSVDGVEWSPRQLLAECACELTYPSILGTVGPERLVGNELSVVAVASDSSSTFRWENTTVERFTMVLTGQLEASS